MNDGRTPSTSPHGMEQSNGENAKLRARSGCVKVDSPLVSFLYDLLRDHLTPGVVEKLMREAHAGVVTYSNGYLANYAVDLARRLGDAPKVMKGK